jgi:hypothetical protein
MSACAGFESSRKKPEDRTIEKPNPTLVSEPTLKLVEIVLKRCFDSQRSTSLTGRSENELLASAKIPKKHEPSRGNF